MLEISTQEYEELLIYKLAALQEAEKTDSEWSYSAQIEEVKFKLSQISHS